MAKILVVYYSTYGHVFEMAKAVADGAKEVEGTEVKLVRVEELEKARKALAGQEAYEKAQEAQKDIPVATLDDLRWADGIIWGSPTRYGNMAAQLKEFIDSTGELWMKGELEGKPTAVFTSTASIHGGQESTLLSMMVPLLHFGMLIVGLNYGENQEMLTTEGLGGTPYGATTLAGPTGERQPAEAELTMARRLGARVASVTTQLEKGRS